MIPTSLAVLTDRRISSEESPAVRSEVSYFRSRLSRHRLHDWLREEKAAGRKRIGLMCWGVPAEIVLASGGIPVRLSGIWEDAGKSRWTLPRDICPLAASCFTDAQALVREGLLDAIVLPETCDWKRKLSDLIEGINVLVLEAPSSRSLTFVDADLKRFARDVALVTDLPVVTRNLRRASESMARAHEACASLQRLRQSPRYAVSGATALAVEQAFLRDTISRWTEHCRRLVRLLEEEPLPRDTQPAEHGARILLMGSPVMWKEGSLVHLIEEAGGRVVCEDFHSRLSLFYPGERSTGGTRAAGSPLASRWSRSCFCSLTAEAEENLLFRAVDDFAVEGVIGHTYRSCARVQMALPGVWRRMSERGIPFLALETQADPNEADRLRARIEPFIEMLLGRRRDRA